MAEELRALFARAHAEGGMAAAGKLAFRLRITSQEAAALPDAPALVAAGILALDELLREARAAAPAHAAQGPVATAGGGTGKIARYFAFAMEHGGLPAVVKLAGRTGLTRQAAAAVPETPETLAKVREALVALLPGVHVPRL